MINFTKIELALDLLLSNDGYLLEKNVDLNFKNYLKKEKSRNAEIGIFQLSMEFFSLHKKLECLVNKIVKEEKIDISFEY